MLWPRAGARSGEAVAPSRPAAEGLQADVPTRGRRGVLVHAEELVVFTHIVAPLCNPHINMYFWHYLDGLFFCLFALKVQRFLTLPGHSQNRCPKAVARPEVSKSICCSR